jgi:hypothetical protein
VFENEVDISNMEAAGHFSQKGLHDHKFMLGFRIEKPSSPISNESKDPKFTTSG